ncbi:MAG TPA: NADH-dependent [FeFe] hydrogenase, group A6 [bacterium]|nr:NADH-dependent [FeFe] hydrogenase, group A6 [bacterium]HPQ65519.1 NADH-dependent [FeFe] hydrogenase, group A6 [bacterium]
MIKAFVNDIPVEVEEGTTILEAARRVQVKIPTLCAHPDLPPSAACGLCVVKIKGSQKMQRACCTPLEEGMEIVTHDPELVKVRRTIVELILSNHPNYCLTCGRNNNCELQKLVADFAIRDELYDKIVRDLPQDSSTGTIVLDPDKCIKCGRCVEVCQILQDVWALSFLERGFNTRISPAGDIQLAESPCIKCGQCSAHCPTGAIFEQDDTRRVWDALLDPAKHCVVQIAPSVRVAVGEGFGLPPGTDLTRKTYALFRRLGFSAVFDTCFSADVTIMEEGAEFTERLKAGAERLPMITTCCPAWIDFMEKFYPEMIDHFSSVKSPQQILGVLAKTYYAQDRQIDPASIVMVSVMPCTAKKFEITRNDDMYASGSQDVDIVITTRELIRMIRQIGIDFLNLPDEDPDHILADYSGAGVIFGATGGVMEAALRTAHYMVTGENYKRFDFKELRGLAGIKEASIKLGSETLKIAVAQGLANVSQVLDRVIAAQKAGKPLPYHFIEVMACPGGCVGGGGQPYPVTDEVREARAAGIYRADRDSPIRYSHENPAVQALYNEFLGKPLGKRSEQLLHTSYRARPLYKK